MFTFVRCGWRLSTLGPAIALVTLWFSVVSAQPVPDTMTILTIGNSRIQADTASAKNAAIAEAIRVAVQSAATGMLAAPEMTKNFEAISQLLAAKPNEFVQGYRILKEFRTDDAYRVLLETTVMSERLNAELARTGMPAASGDMPKVVLLIAEKHLNDLDYQYWWEKHATPPDHSVSEPIAAILRENGMAVVSPDEAGNHTEDLYIGLEMAAIPPDFEAAMFGKRLGAELVIVGTAVAEPSLNRMGQDIRTIKGSIDLRILKTDTGEILDIVRENAVGFGPDLDSVVNQAFSDAADQAGRQLVAKIGSLRETPDATTGGPLILRVSGENILLHLEKLRRAIMKTKGVATLQTDEMTPNSATLSVAFEGTPQEMADALLMQPYDRFGINIKEITVDGLIIELVPE